MTGTTWAFSKLGPAGSTKRVKIYVMPCSSLLIMDRRGPICSACRHPESSQTRCRRSRTSGWSVPQALNCLGCFFVKTRWFLHLQLAQDDDLEMQETSVFSD